MCTEFETSEREWKLVMHIAVTITTTPENYLHFYTLLIFLKRLDFEIVCYSV